MIISIGCLAGGRSIVFETIMFVAFMLLVYRSSQNKSCPLSVVMTCIVMFHRSLPKKLSLANPIEHAFQLRAGLLILQGPEP